MTYLNSETEGFVMDDLGNRVGNQTLRGDGSVNFAVDALTNRYTSVGGNSLAYDDAGNLTQDKDGYRFTYDHENRIIEVRNSSDSLVAQMDYDSQGRRIKVYDAVADTTTLYYYSDNWQVLSQYTGGTLDKSFVYGNYIDEVLVMLGDTSTYFYLHDHLYSPVALFNASGAVIERYEYDAYGKATVWNSDFSSTYAESQYGNPYAFTGRELDLLDRNASGVPQLKLMHYRHRAYNSEIGRFMQQDPHGIVPHETRNVFYSFNQYFAGLNLYSYSSPIFSVDPFGLWDFLVHQRATSLWAQQIGYSQKAAQAIGAADEAVDGFGKGPWPIGGNQGYHFNRNLEGGIDTRLDYNKKHYDKAVVACLIANDDPKQAAEELGTALHPLQDWIAHGDYSMKNKGKIWTQIHNAGSPQRDLGDDPSAYPDDTRLDAQNSPDGRPTSGVIIDELIVWEGTTKKVYTDFAYYESGTKRYDLTKFATSRQLEDYLSFIKSDKAGCKCKEYFGVSQSEN